MKNKLSELRKEILRSQTIENKNIKSILKWLKKRDKVNNMKVSKTSVNELKFEKYSRLSPKKLIPGAPIKIIERIVIIITTKIDIQKSFFLNV